MPLFERLVGTEDPKLPVHQFMAALAEYKRGEVTGVQVATAFDLSAGEATNLQEFLDNLDADTISRDVIHDVLLLAEGGYYTIPNAKIGLRNLEDETVSFFNDGRKKAI